MGRKVSGEGKDVAGGGESLGPGGRSPSHEWRMEEAGRSKGESGRMQ